MKLNELAKKPQLIQVTIDDEDIVQEYGEALEFHTWDRQPMDVFLKLGSMDQDNPAQLVSAVRDLILDEKGKPILDGESVLPLKVMMRVINRVVEGLGKL